MLLRGLKYVGSDVNILVVRDRKYVGLLRSFEEFSFTDFRNRLDTAKGRTRCPLQPESAHGRAVEGGLLIH